MDRSKLDTYLPNLCRICRACARGARWTGRLAQKVARKTWKPIVILLTVLVVLHTAAVLITGALVKRELDKIRAIGEPISYSDLNRQSHSLSKQNTQAIERAFNAIKHLDRKHYSYTNEPYREIVGDTVDLSKEEWQIVHEIAVYMKPLLPDLEYIAQRRCIQVRNNHPCDITDIPGYARSIRTYLMVAALDAARNGNNAEAVKLFKLGYKISVSLLNIHIYEFSPRTIAAGTGILLQRLNCYTKLSDDLLHQLSACVTQPINRQYVTKHTLGLRIDVFETYDYLRSYGIPGAFIDCSDSNRGRPFLSEKMTGYFQSPFFNINEIASLRDFEKNKGLAQLPYRTLILRFGELGMRYASPTLPRKWWLWAANTCASVNCMHIALSRDLTLAEHRANRLFIDILRYKNKHGEYPQQLNDLRAFVGRGLPLDPFSGKDFQYIRKGREFVLYSIGADMKDDKGITQKDVPLNNTYDIVRSSFPRVRSAEEIKKRALPLTPLPTVGDGR